MPAKIIDNDDLLLKMLVTNDEQAINILYQQYHSHLLNIINGIIHDPERAKDIAQDLFVVLWERRHSLQITKPIKAYLIKAAIHRSLNFLRDNTRYQLFYEQEKLDRLKSVHSSGASLELEELRKLIKSAILSLPPKGKTVFILSRKHNMTYEEIATHLDISKKAVEKHISKALKYLSKILKVYLKSLLLFFTL